MIIFDRNLENSSDMKNEKNKEGGTNSNLSLVGRGKKSWYLPSVETKALLPDD